MTEFMIALFAVAVIGVPIFILLRSQQGKKRGCGGGCATCGNRALCHREQQYKGKEPLE